MMKALTAADLEEIYGYSRETIYRWADPRVGKLPAPLNPSLGRRMWRWSPVEIEAHVAGRRTEAPTARRLGVAG
jgi:predicted DNA-binding transcriptional regulator AlpA